MSLLLLLDDGPPFPRSLFSAGEQGIWLDPSDFSTMFQDAAGTTPVTAVGQPVGLALDKRLGLERGPELVTNGDFSNGATGWTTSGLVSIGGGAANFNSALSGANVLQSVAISTSKFYAVTYTITSISSGSVSAAAGGALGAVRTAPGTYTDILLPIAATIYVRARADNTTAVIDNISVREIAGNHAYQTTLAARPKLQRDSNGLYYLSFDGTDDGMATPSIDFTGTDKMTVWAGVRKLSDAAAAIIAELSANESANVGSFVLYGPSSALNNYRLGSRGSASISLANAGGYSSPVSSVIVGVGDIAGDVSRIRVNGAVIQTTTSDQGTGNYGNYPLYIGRRAGTSLPFNGRIYQLIVRGVESNAGQIAATEAYVNAKMRAY